MSQYENKYFYLTKEGKILDETLLKWKNECNSTGVNSPRKNETLSRVDLTRLSDLK